MGERVLGARGHQRPPRARGPRSGPAESWGHVCAASPSRGTNTTAWPRPLPAPAAGRTCEAHAGGQPYPEGNPETPGPTQTPPQGPRPGPPHGQGPRPPRGGHTAWPPLPARPRLQRGPPHGVTARPPRRGPHTAWTRPSSQTHKHRHTLARWQIMAPDTRPRPGLARPLCGSACRAPVPREDPAWVHLGGHGRALLPLGGTVASLVPDPLPRPAPTGLCLKGHLHRVRALRW